jgi:alanyl-tRNA synthetase
MIARERGQDVDAEGFERALNQQRRRSRAARSGERPIAEGPAVITRERGEWVDLEPGGAQHWVGYDTTRAETKVLAFRQADDVVELVLAENPFYVESGGQVDDTGVVRGAGWELTVEDVDQVDGRSAVAGHFPDAFAPDRAPVLAQVNEGRRRNIERNHTATHLVHAALRKILGTHVRQAGSVVAPDRLRFDFSHHGEVPDDVLAAIEEEVNAHVWENLPVRTRERPYAEALAAGAMAFFTEKYGDVVRTVEVPGVSLELCGGTHVRSTGEIGLLRFTHEVGAAAGVRRVEAITGLAAYRHGSRWSAACRGGRRAQGAPRARGLAHRGAARENRKLEWRVRS